MKCASVTELDRLEDFLESKEQLHCAVVQGLDLRELEVDWDALDVSGAIFLGCKFPAEISIDSLVRKGAAVFPEFPHLPYRPYRGHLYTREELMEGWTPEQDESVDKRIYDHFVEKRENGVDVLESLAQRLHDHAIDDGLTDLLEGKIDGEPKKVVAIMGGHGTSRDDPFFQKVVRIARDLTKAGYFVASGGGPGIMEAANMGAWLKDASNEELDEIFAILSEAPTYLSDGYMEAALKVLEMHPNGGASVAIPTWFYGHEPSNLFSTYIAKYFSNSIREDGLLAIAQHGVIFGPGSAGAVQEVFMDACQNHYGTFHWISPMVFLGRERWGGDSQIFEAVKFLAKGKPYEKSLALVDTAEQAATFIKGNPPFRLEA